jgi:hypothetical protein
MNIGRYIRNVGVAADKMLNAVLLGDPNETISSRMGRQILAGKCVFCKFACRLLDVFWPNHCINNIKKE